MQLYRLFFEMENGAGLQITFGHSESLFDPVQIAVPADYCGIVGHHFLNIRVVAFYPRQLRGFFDKAFVEHHIFVTGLEVFDPIGF